MNLLKRALVGTTLCALSVLAAAQSYPNAAMRWIVPYPAGGGTDVVAHMLAEPMSQAMGQTIVIDNKPGGGAMIAGELMARAKPDGLIFGTVDTSTVALTPHLYAKVPYQSDKDFSYIGGTTRFPFVLVVHPALPVKDLQDLLGGQIDMYLVNTAANLPHIKAGKLRPIALSMAQCSAVLPDVPTFAEAGVPDFESYSRQGLVAPAGTPPAVVARLNTELNKALAAPEVLKKLAELGIEPSPTTPADFTQFVKAQNTLWGGVIKAANFKLA